MLIILLGFAACHVQLPSLWGTWSLPLSAKWHDRRRAFPFSSSSLLSWGRTHSDWTADALLCLI